MDATTNLITAPDYGRLNELLHSRDIRRLYGSVAETLSLEIKHRQIVSPARIPREVVTMNSTVQVCDLASRRRSTYTLVYPHEADFDQGKVSVMAPLGTALLSARVDQTVEYSAPAGIRRLKVEKIVYQPEAAGDHHL